MKRSFVLFLTIALTCFVLNSCKSGGGEEQEADQQSKSEVIEDQAPAATTAVAVLESKSGSSTTGTVTFTEKDGMVTMMALISHATPGNHAIHIHDIGDCSAEDGKSAGGHWNPTEEGHGHWGTPPFHRGDIGNIEVGEDGNGSISRTTDLWTIGGEDAIKNILGHSIIVHEGPDDFTSQPSGAAGPRIACGVIEKQ